MSLANTEKTSTGRSSHSNVPPGPRSLNPLSSTLAFKRTPLSFLTAMSQRYGDIWQFRLLKWPTVVLNHPNYLKYILQEKYQLYDKNVHFFDTVRLVGGNGLVTNNDGAHWLRQRRLIQPTFHKQRLAGFATTMVDMTLESLQRWEAMSRKGQPISIMEEMHQLVLRIICETMFSTDIGGQTSVIGHAWNDINTFLNDYYHMPFPPLSVPTPRNSRFRNALGSLNAVVDDLIRLRHESNEERGDILSMLLHARDEQTGESMSDQQLHDEVLTLLIGGSDTTVSSLTWIWYMLHQHPEVEWSLHEELDRVLGGRTPTVNDLPQLSYTRMVIDEVLRLYTPAWLFMRRAVQNDEIEGYHLPKGIFVLVSPYALHRHPGIWEKPEQFRPERFLPEQAERRPRFSYLPFGGGPRICIGNNFALMEMTLVVATLAQRYHMELLPEQGVEPMPLITLRPNKEILVYLRPRR